MKTPFYQLLFTAPDTNPKTAVPWRVLIVVPRASWREPFILPLNWMEKPREINFARSAGTLRLWAHERLTGRRSSIASHNSESSETSSQWNGWDLATYCVFPMTLGLFLCHTGAETRAHTTKDKQKFLNRVRRIKGQLSGIESSSKLSRSQGVAVAPSCKTS